MNIPVINHGKWGDWNRQFYSITENKQSEGLTVKVRTLNIFQRILRFLFGAYNDTIFTQRKINRLSPEAGDELVGKLNAVGKKFFVPYPNGAFGPAEWQELGIQIDEVPPVPEVILNRANPDNYFVVLIPGKVNINELIRRSEIKIDWVLPEAEHGHKADGRPYWVAIEKELMPNSCDKETRKEQLDLASQDGKHQAPSVLEAVACNIASMKATGEGLRGRYGERRLFEYICCREDTLGRIKLSSDRERFVVGCSCLFGFHFSYNNGTHDVGVARLLRG